MPAKTISIFLSTLILVISIHFILREIIKDRKHRKVDRGPKSLNTKNRGRGEDHVKMEAEIGMMCLQTKECCGLQTTIRETRRES